MPTYSCSVSARLLQDAQVTAGRSLQSSTSTNVSLAVLVPAGTPANQQATVANAYASSLSTVFNGTGTSTPISQAYAGALTSAAKAQGVNPASYSSAAIGSPVIANLPPVPPTPTPVDLGVAIGVPIGVVAAIIILSVAVYYSVKESDKVSNSRKALSSVQTSGGATAANVLSTHLTDSEQTSSSFRGENPMMKHQQSAGKVKFAAVTSNPQPTSDGTFIGNNPMRAAED
jgi:hypothetical protein